MSHEFLQKVLASDKIQKAKQLGQKAFKEGMKRVPAQDKALMDMIEPGSEVGSSNGILKAWTQGWDAANLKGPVESKEKETQDPCPECGLKHTHQLGCKTGNMPTHKPESALSKVLAFGNEHTPKSKLKKRIMKATGTAIDALYNLEIELNNMHLGKNKEFDKSLNELRAKLRRSMDELKSYDLFDLVDKMYDGGEAKE